MAVMRKNPTDELLGQVGDFLAARQLAGRRVCVGFSGGCDSTLLLHLIARVHEKTRLSAIHVQHGLSPRAPEWAEFCRRTCEKLAIPLQIVEVSVQVNGQGLEAAARAERYRVFAQVAAEAIALAQHRGDQAETVLFNLLRGAGVAGLAAMPAERLLGSLRLIRPLLAVSRQTIESVAGALGLCWVEDESNGNPAYTRNDLRHRVLPALKCGFPAAEETLAQAAMHCAEANGLLDELAALDWQRWAVEDTLPVQAFVCLSPARGKNLLRYRLRLLGWQAPAAARLNEFVRQLAAARPDRHPRIDLADGSLFVRGHCVHFAGHPPGWKTA